MKNYIKKYIAFLLTSSIIAAAFLICDFKKDGILNTDYLGIYVFSTLIYSLVYWLFVKFGGRRE